MQAMQRDPPPGLGLKAVAIFYATTRDAAVGADFLAKYCVLPAPLEEAQLKQNRLLRVLLLPRHDKEAKRVVFEAHLSETLCTAFLFQWKVKTFLNQI